MNKTMLIIAPMMIDFLLKVILKLLKVRARCEDIDSNGNELKSFCIIAIGIISNPNAAKIEKRISFPVKE